MNAAIEIFIYRANKILTFHTGLDPVSFPSKLR